MNTLNRVVLVILLLGVMVLCSFVLVVPLPTLRVIGEQAGLLADSVARIRPVVRLPLGILLAVIVNIVAILLIVVEVGKPAPKSISVEHAAGGEVTLSIASVADQLKAEISQLPEVLKAKPKVSAKRKGVAVEIDAQIAAQTGLPGKAERIVETVRRVVEEGMGLKLARPPRVNIETIRQAPGAEHTEQAETPFSSPEELS